MSEQRIKSEKINEEECRIALLNCTQINVDFLRGDIQECLRHRGITTSISFKRNVKNKIPSIEIYLIGNFYEKLTIFP